MDIKENLIELKRSQPGAEEKAANEKLKTNLYVLDTQLDGIRQIFFENDARVLKYGYFTFELCVKTALFHLDVYTMLAIAESTKAQAVNFARKSAQLVQDY